jgi:alkylation response protein AidB-like acyl-CoA dehydrogenase
MISLEALELTETQLAIQSLAKKFAEKEIKPIAAALDRVQNPAAPEAFPWDMLKKACELGLKTLTLPKEYGGPEENIDLTTRMIVLETMGYVDYSCSKILSQLWKTIEVISKVGTKEQKDRFLPQIRDDDSYVISIGMTEPEAGSDNMLPYEGPEGGMRTTAERKGDGYVINGMKHFISMGFQCKLCLLRASTGKTTDGRKSISVFLVPKDTPGFSVGTPHDKTGSRAYGNCELFFDNVYVPRENLLGGVEGGDLLSSAINGGEIEVAVLAMASARAAFDAAVQYAKERVQGGRRIIEHQAVGIRIADMYMQLNSCDSLVWRTIAELNKGKPCRDLCVACKVHASEVATNACLTALQIFGGSGVDRTFPLERYLRDSIILLHGGGTADVMRLKMVSLLAGENLYGKPVMQVR